MTAANPPKPSDMLRILQAHPISAQATREHHIQFHQVVMQAEERVQPHLPALGSPSELAPLPDLKSSERHLAMRFELRVLELSEADRIASVQPLPDLQEIVRRRFERGLFERLYRIQTIRARAFLYLWPSAAPSKREVDVRMKQPACLRQIASEVST
jgi:hypothetical protein